MQEAVCECCIEGAPKVFLPNGTIACGEQRLKMFYGA
jgi:hypothetical protein